MDYHRRSIRLGGYNYSENGYYFVTICLQNKLKLFWNIENKINGKGLMIDYWFDQISKHFKNVLLDEFIIMPDHIRFVLVINNYLGRTHRSARTLNQLNKIVGVDRCVDPIIENKKTLGNVIQWFKTITTNEYIKNIKQNNWLRFEKRLWQRNYYERIIRNEKEYLMIKKYIRDNPKNLFKK